MIRLGEVEVVENRRTKVGCVKTPKGVVRRFKMSSGGWSLIEDGVSLTDSLPLLSSDEESDCYRAIIIFTFFFIFFGSVRRSLWLARMKLVEAYILWRIIWGIIWRIIWGIIWRIIGSIIGGFIWRFWGLRRLWFTSRLFLRSIKSWRQHRNQALWFNKERRKKNISS